MTSPGKADNMIPLRIAEMLGKYPPFSLLDQEDVLGLARAARVRALAQGDLVWKQGDSPGAEIYFLARGRVEYHWQNSDTNELVDVRDVGDLLGLRAGLENEPFRVSAYVAEDVIMYVIDLPALQTLLDANDGARYYVRRHLFWSTRVGVRMSPLNEGTSAAGSNSLLAHFNGGQLIRPRALNRLLTCSPEDSMLQAATLMTSKRVPSIVVVDEERRPLGVVTSTDLVKYGIVGNLPPQSRVAEVMAKPVITVAKGSSAMAATLLMLRARIGQVCVTEDGSANSPVLDVCTHKDLLAETGHNPAGMIREIRAARGTARLRELCDELEHLATGYLESGLSAIYIAQVFAELHDELVGRLIAMASRELQAKGIGAPRVDWAWMAVGSDGRREQILRTDMDNGVVFRSSGSAELDESNRAVLLRLTGRVVEMLVECGFARCQGGIMASNPRWCRTDKEWREEFTGSEIFQGDRLLRLITLLDLRPVTGDAALARSLRIDLFNLVREAPFLQRKLAEIAVGTPPPLNFWGNFVVEKRGSAVGQFDIKARGLNPIRDAARLLAIRYNFPNYSTGGRLGSLRRLNPEMADTAAVAYQTYDFMFRLRSITGLQRGDSGRYIEPGTLGKMQRASLTHGFDVQRVLQRIIRNEFGLEWER